MIGHRGAAGLRPENTLPSFVEAVRLGVDAVELDVQSVQGTLIVLHDDRVDRTTNGRGTVAELSLEELRRLDAGNGARVPLLDEVFEVIPPHVGINVELKGADTAEPLAQFLRNRPSRDVLVSSFDHDELRRFHAASPDVPVAPLFSRWRRDAIHVARELAAWSINVALRATTAERVRQVCAAGLELLVYTVNDPLQARHLVGMGVSGLFTDFPDRITASAVTGC